jgi:photosystem II stability/assembly factor-like uncharacterized protein
MRGRLSPLFFLLIFLTRGAAADGENRFGELRWRSIGPYRGGRTKAAAGVPSRPGTFYIGACNGGVWKTDDYGRTWTPLFDDQPTGSIGALAVAASNPDIVYVGSGEGLQRPDLSTGDGIYKSIDAGRTWRHLGLRDGQQIPQIVVDPRDPNRLFVAVLGHPYGPNAERGLYRSLDGGESFQRVLHRDPDTGAADVALDPVDPQVVYAVLWESREAPWENGSFSGPGSGLFKSTDGGTTWRRLEKGLPTYERDQLGRMGIGIAPSDPRRIYLTVETRRRGSLYRSDDAGESWVKITEDSRVAERPSDFAEVKVHPRNPDVVFTASVVTWKSSDGGKSFTALRGAPGGDDYQRIWIDPLRPDVMLLAGDQGAIVTVNGGQSWSSWYNQPTAQMFHVTADNAFPYRLCGGQQESGSACVSSRGPDGAISFRDWRPAGVEEYGYAAPDPLDPDVVYGGKVSRHDRRTGQTQDVGPHPSLRPDYRTIRTQPLVFSPVDPHTLYFAANTVWKTVNGGQSWTQISPDLTRPSWAAPPSVGKYAGSDAARPRQRGVVYALAPSPLDRGTLWAGTDDGRIHVTRDGGRSWADVTPAALGPWMKVSTLEAGHFDRGTAYAAVNTLRLDDLRPHLYRTHDGGKTWTEIVSGIPAGEPSCVVREDPRRRGLLYAGTERAVYVSFDDGARWQSLRRNMPATSIRDLLVKDDDLAVATHGRGFWILDDVTPLRQVDDKLYAAEAALLAPAPAWRVRHSVNRDTPLPPDEAVGQNPPEGAILDYYLRDAASVGTGPLALEIFDAAGASVRRFASDDPAPEPPRDAGNIPGYWMRPPAALSTAPGLHRFVWDLHGPPPAAVRFSYPMSAVPHDTPPEPRGVRALPGGYQVKLTVAGKTYAQPLVVKLDPRVKTPLSALRREHELALRVVAAIARNRAALDELRRARAGLRGRPDAEGRDRELAALEGSDEPRWFFELAGGAPGPPTLAGLNLRLVALLGRLEEADVAPTPQLAKAVEQDLAGAAELVARWERLRQP